ncbi:MAG: hypothetical protein WDN48_17520 [Pseudolabrys sp.]
MGIMVIAGVFALAVIGTAGAFGYRALFGSSSVATAPRVIKADTAPSKIVPVANTDSQSSKQITDRINDRGLGEKLVSREEQPVEIKDKPTGVVYPQGPAGNQAPGGQRHRCRRQRAEENPHHHHPSGSAAGIGRPHAVLAGAGLGTGRGPTGAACASCCQHHAGQAAASRAAAPAADESGPSPAATRVAPRVAAAPAPARLTHRCRSAPTPRRLRPPARPRRHAPQRLLPHIRPPRPEAAATASRSRPSAAKPKPKLRSAACKANTRRNWAASRLSFAAPISATRASTTRAVVPAGSNGEALKYAPA